MYLGQRRERRRARTLKLFSGKALVSRAPGPGPAGAEGSQHHTHTTGAEPPWRPPRTWQLSVSCSGARMGLACSPPLWWSRSLGRRRPEWTPRPPTTWAATRVISVPARGMLMVSEGQRGGGRRPKGNLPDVRVVDIKRQTHHSQDNAQAGQYRDRDEEFLGHEAKCLDDKGLVSRGGPSCAALGVRGGLVSRGPLLRGPVGGVWSAGGPSCMTHWGGVLSAEGSLLHDTRK